MAKGNKRRGLVRAQHTHNRGGGIIFPQKQVDAICARAADLGMRTYLDGARLFNAAIATEEEIDVLASPFGLVAVSLSKGLGCPIGSILAGDKDDIRNAVRIRRMLGGAWRQAGIIAAAGLYALERNIERLAEDHENARLIADTITDHPAIDLDLGTVQTNIIVFDVKPPVPDAAQFTEDLAEEGVKVIPFGPRTVRATTHLNLDRSECAKAADAMLLVLSRYQP